MNNPPRPVKPKKHLGQHFLNDPSIALRIAECITAPLDHPMLEIGPGTGALTQPMIALGRTSIEVVDLDIESIQHLQDQNWVHEANVRIHHGDILKWTANQWDTIAKGRPFAIVGNFPYNISSQILFRALELGDRISELTGMFQKEVAERICAPPGNKTYGILSVLMQAHFHCHYEFTVDEKAFHPPPKVKSGVIHCKRKTPDEIPSEPSPEHLRRVVKTAFNQRRKTLRNALRSGGYDLSNVQDAMLSLRAEALSVEEFQELARKLLHQGTTRS